MIDELNAYSPVRNWMLLEPELPPEVSEGGLFIPEQARDQLTQGRIVKTGPLVNDYQVGQMVVFGQHTEARVKLNKKLYLLLEESSVIMCKTISDGDEGVVIADSLLQSNS